MLSRQSCLLVALPMLLGWAGALRADDDPVVRGKRVTEWFKFLHEEQDARKRQAALLILDTQAGPKVGIVFPGFLKELKEHPDVATRVRICELLIKYKEKGDDLVKALVVSLKTDKDARVRETAAATLGKLERGAFSAASDLADAMKDKSPVVRAAAIDSLGQFCAIDPGIGKDAVDELATCLKDPDLVVRTAAVATLARMGAAAGGAVSALAEMVGGAAEPKLRKDALKALTAIGSAAGSATPVVLKALQDPQAEVRQQAAVALGKVSPDAATVLPELLKAVKDKDKTVRCHVIHAIGALGKAATPAIPELIRLLKDDEVGDVRLAAIEELAGFGPDAKDAIGALQTASRDGKPAIREAAQEALKRIQPAPN